MDTTPHSMTPSTFQFDSAEVSVTTDDLKGYLVPVNRKFKKGCLFSLQPRIDDNYSVCFVVDWLEKAIYVTARHGQGCTHREYRGEEWSVSVHSAMATPIYSDDVLSNAELQEHTLKIARTSQEFLRTAREDGNGDLPDDIKNTIMTALNPAIFVVGAKDEYGNQNVDDYSMYNATVKVQVNVLEKIGSALSSIN